MVILIHMKFTRKSEHSQRNNGYRNWFVCTILSIFFSFILFLFFNPPTKKKNLVQHDFLLKVRMKSFMKLKLTWNEMANNRYGAFLKLERLQLTKEKEKLQLPWDTPAVQADDRSLFIWPQTDQCFKPAQLKLWSFGFFILVLKGCKY